MPCHKDCTDGVETFNFDFAIRRPKHGVDTLDDEDGEDGEVTEEAEDSVWTTTEGNAVEEEDERRENLGD